MSRTVKVVAAFASLGFFLPCMLFAPHTDPLVYLCPTSIISMGLDGSSLSTAITVWFFICLSNAILYAAPPAVVLLFVHLFRPAPRPPSILR